VLPTGHACTVDGDDLPFLGEVWSLPWNVQPESDNAIRLTREGVITPFRIERRMELKPEDPRLWLDYIVTNIGTAPFSFIWGFHPSFPIGPKTHIDIPGRRVEYGEGDRPAELANVEFASWPIASVAQLNAAPTGSWSLLYVTELEKGLLSVFDDVWEIGVSVSFPKNVFDCVWVWLVDGGWRGIRCVAVEPWTGYPARLDKAIGAGRALTLNPGEQLGAEIVLEPIDARLSLNTPISVGDL
jgi:galactose mutarotase-like enzyme